MSSTYALRYSTKLMQTSCNHYNVLQEDHLVSRFRFLRYKPSYMRRLIKKEKFNGKTILTAPCDEIATIREVDTVNTYDRRRIFGSLSHWGPEYTQPQFDDKESFLKFMDTNDPRSALRRSKLPKYHWVTRRLRVTPTRKFTGTLASNSRKVENIHRDKSMTPKDGITSTNHHDENDESTPIAKEELIELIGDDKCESLASLSTDHKRENANDRSESLVDVLRRTISDGSLSLLSAASDGSNPSSPVPINSHMGDASENAGKSSISSVVNMESKRHKAAKGICTYKQIFTSLHI